MDSAEAYESEDEAPEGSLNYRQYYPTMLPFLPPEEEAALQGVQQQQAFQPDAPVQVHVRFEVLECLSFHPNATDPNIMP